MTFDSDIENESLQSTSKGKVWFLLIVTEDFKAVCRLGVKFGATFKTSRLLLKRAKELTMDVTGVSLHAGSGCTDPEALVLAVSGARCVFDMGTRDGFPSGFPSHCQSEDS